MAELPTFPSQESLERMVALRAVQSRRARGRGGFSQQELKSLETAMKKGPVSASDFLKLMGES